MRSNLTLVAATVVLTTIITQCVSASITYTDEVAFLSAVQPTILESLCQVLQSEHTVDGRVLRATIDDNTQVAFPRVPDIQHHKLIIVVIGNRYCRAEQIVK